MRRVAILVLAHRLAPLPYLLRALGDRFDVFLHLDAETDAAGLVLPPGVTMVPRRAVHWGGFSMMQATLELMAAAREHDVLALVSGDALPLLPPEALHAALAEEGERIELVEVPDDPALAGLPREAAVAKHGWEQPWRFYNFVHWDDRLLNPFGAGETARHFGLAEDTADWLRGEAQRLVGEVLGALPARPRLYPRLLYGSQWWALSGQTVAMLLEALGQAEVQAYFRFFPVPDEHMVHTVLGALRPDLVPRPPPMWRAAAALDAAGMARARAEGRLFARKFDPAAAPALAEAVLAGEVP